MVKGSESQQDKSQREAVTRISVSLPRDVAEGLDQLVHSRGFDNRSQAVASMVREEILENQRDGGEGVMTGTVTLFYNQSSGKTLGEVARIKRRFIAEVIGSLQVQLEHDHLMEVIVVQGPVRILEEVADRLLGCKGVKVGKLTLTSTLIPPVHPFKTS